MLARLGSGRIAGEKTAKFAVLALLPLLALAPLLATLPYQEADATHISATTPNRVNYNQETGVLHITWNVSSRNGDADVKQEQIWLGTANSGPWGTSQVVNLAGAEVISSGTAQDGLRIQLTEEQRRAMISVTFTGIVSPLADTFRRADGHGTYTGYNVDNTGGIQFIVTPDTRNPTIPGSSVMDDGARMLTMTFSESVKDGADVDLTKIIVSDGTRTTQVTPSSLTSLEFSTLTSTDSFSDVAVLLPQPKYDLIAGYSTPHLSFDAGAIKDFSDNALAASTSSTAVISNVAFKSAEVDLNNFADSSSANGRSAGKLVIYFTEDVQARTSNTDALSKITIQERDDSPSLTLGSGASVSVSSNTVTIGLSPAQKETIKGMADLEILVDHGAFAQSGGSTPVASSGVTEVPAATADTTGPVVTAVSLNEGVDGPLSITFDEYVDVSGANGAAFYLRESTPAALGSTGEVTLSAGEIKAGQSDGETFEFELDEDSRQGAIALSDPYLYVAAGAIDDTAANGIAAKVAGTDAAQIFDTAGPQVSTVAIDEGTGILTITFDETIDASSASSSGASFEIRNNANAADGSTGEVTLSNSERQSGQTDGLTLKFELDEDSRQGVIALSNPHLYVAAGAVADTINFANSLVPPNYIVAKTAGTVISQTPDNDPPTVSSAALNEETGLLTITFSETVDVSSATGASFELRDGASATDNLSGEVVLSGGEIQAGQTDGLTLKFELDEDSRRDAIALATPYLYTLAGAITDVITPTANGIVYDAAGTSVSTTPDANDPTLVTSGQNAPALDEASGVLTLTFSESVKEGANVDLAKIFINDGSFASPAGTALTGSTVTSTADTDAEITVELTEALRQTAIGYAAPHVRLDSGAVKDLSDRNVASTAAAEITGTPDTTAPRLVATGQNGPALNEETGILTLTFNETVKASDSDVDQSKIFINDGSFSSPAGTPLTGATVTSTGDALAVTVELTEAQRKAAIGYATPHVRLAQGAVKDFSNQDVAASASAEITDTADTTAPQISSTAPVFLVPARMLTIVFDESVNDSTVDLTKIFIRDGSGTTGGTALSTALSSSTVTSTDDTDAEIAIRVTETIRDAVAAQAYVPHLYFTQGAVSDLSNQGIAASTASTAVTKTYDQVPPEVSSAALNEETGLLTITFNENVDANASGINGADFQLREGAGAAGGSAGEVTLSNAEIKSGQDDGLTFEFELSPDSRLGAIALSNPYLYIAAGGIEDIALNPIAANVAGTDVSQTLDTTAPALVATGNGRPALDEGTGILTLTFNEDVKDGSGVDLSRIFIRDGPGAGGAALTGSAVVSEDTDEEITVDLSEALRQSAIGYATPYVRLDAGAVRDLSDLPAAAATAEIADTPDALRPLVSSAELDEASGVLTLTFDEWVKDSADLAKIFMADGSFVTGGTALTGSQITSSGDSDARITIQLTETLAQAGAVYAAPHLRFERSAVEDLSDLSVDPVTLEISDRPDPSVLPAIMSAESVSPHTVRIYFNMPMTGAGSPEAWSAGGSGAVSVRVPQERVITQDIPPPPRPDLPTLLWPVPASWTTQYLDPDAVISAYVTFRDPVMSGQSLSYAPGDVQDFHDRAVAAQSIQISARSAYAPVDTAAVLASAITDGQASGSPVSPGEPYRTVKNYDPGYAFNIPSITHYHSLGGAADVDVYAVDGEELARTLYSGTWSTVRYDPATEQAHLSGRIGSPDTPAETVSLRGSAGTFAVVASAGDNGLQIVDITDPYSPRSVSYMADGRSPMYGCADPNQYTGQQLHCITPTTDLAADPLRRLAELDGTDAVEIVRIGDRTFAVAASPGAPYQVGGFQMVDITDPGNPNSGYSVNNGAWAANIDALLTISDLAVFEAGGKTYVAFASQYGGTNSQYQGAVTILDISDPTAIQQISFAVAGTRDSDGRLFDSLYNPVGIDTFVSGGSTYAVVSSLDDWYYGNDGEGSVQIIDLSDPASPKRAASITPGMLDRDGREFGDIYSPGQVKIFELAGVPHAAIVASGGFAATSGEFIQIVNLRDPSAPRSAGVIGPYPDGHPLASLDTIQRIDVSGAGGRTVLAATVDQPDGLFLIDVTNPASPQRLAYARDGHNDPAGVRVGLEDPLGVSLRTVDGRLYAAVASSDAAVTGINDTRGGLTILDLTETAGLGDLHTVTVGALVPLTGPVSSLGEHWEAAMQVGVKDLNERLERTDADWRVSLDIRDSRAEPDTALARLADLNSAGIKAVIGPATSGGVTRVQDYAAANGMTILSYGSTAASLAKQDGIFRLIPPDTLMGPFIAEQLLNAGIKHATIAYRDDAWGVGLAESVRDGFRIGSGYTTALVPFNPSADGAPLDSAALVSQMSATHVASDSAVLLFDFSTDTVEIMAAADAASSAPGATPGAAALGTSQWFGTSVLDTILSHTDQVRDFASQVRYTSVDAVFDRDHPQFERVTREISARLPDGHRDFGIYTYAAYDSVHLMGRAVLLGDSAAASALLENIPAAARGHAGLIGDTTLDANGDLAGTEFQLLQVRGGQAVPIPKYEVPLTVTEFTLTSRHSSGMARGGDSYEPTVAFVVRDGQRVPESVAGSCVDDADNRTIVDISFRAEETFTMGEFDVLINGRSAALQPPLPNPDGSVEETTPPAKQFAAEWAACGTDPDGPLDINIEVMIDGVPVSFGEEKLTGPNVVVDNTAPQLEQASLVGDRSIALFYSEPVVTAASDYTLFEYGASSVPAASSVHGSGTASVLAMLDGSDAELMSSTRIDFTVSGVTDRVGNALLNGGAKSLVPADARDGAVVLRDTARDGRTELALPPDSIVRTVVARQPVAIDASLLPDPASPAASVASAGGQTAEFSSGLTVAFASATVVLPAGLQVGGLPADQTLPMSASSSTVPSDDYVFSYRLDTSQSATLIEVGDPAGRVELSLPARIEFSTPLQELVFVVTGGQTLAVQECPEELTGSSTHAEAAGHLASLEGQDGTDSGSCYVRESSTVWTGHFSAWGTGPALPPSGGSECDDCTPPTLGYDEYGAKLVDGGFAYNGLSSDVAYFFTPYPLIESEVGKQNTVVLKMYENQGPGNVEHVSLAFGLRSGEVISESRAVVNYDISFDDTGTVSVIDPDGAIDIDTLSASHDVVECSEGSSLECLSVTITHTFRAPLEFDIVGTDVWDRERNSWQNYYNHGIRVSGEPMDPQPGIEVDGMLLYRVSSGEDVLVDGDGHLFKLSPEGDYLPLSNQSRLYHDIDESMYIYDGMPMQGYDRGDPQFRDHLYAQVMAAQKVLDSMMPVPEPDAPGPAPQAPDLEAAEQRLREAVLAEQHRAALLFEELFGYQRINWQD